MGGIRKENLVSEVVSNNDCGGSGQFSPEPQCGDAPAGREVAGGEVGDVINLYTAEQRTNASRSPNA